MPIHPRPRLCLRLPRVRALFVSGVLATAFAACAPDAQPLDAPLPVTEPAVPPPDADAGTVAVPSATAQVYGASTLSAGSTPDGLAWTVEAFVRSDEAQPVRITFTPDDGGASVSTGRIDLVAGVSQRFSVNVETRALEGDRRFVVHTLHAETGEVLFETAYVASAEPLAVDAVIERNFYVDETRAAAIFRVRGSRLAGDLVGEVVVELPSPHAPLIVRGPISERSRTVVEVPLAELGEGTHPVRLRVRGAADDARGGAPAIDLPEIGDSLVRRPAPGADVRVTQIDRDRRVLMVDGAPFLPVGVIGVPEQELPAVANAGFNFTLRWRGASVLTKFDPSATQEAQEAVVNPYLDAVHAAGMYAFEAPVKLSQYYFKYKDPNFDAESAKFHQDALPKIVDIAKRHPAVIGYYSYDEPLYAQQNGTTQFGQVVRENDPYHPVYVLFSIAVQHWPGAFEIVGRDYYPMLGSPLSNVHKYALQSATYAHPWRTPYLYMPLFESSSGRPEPLSPAMQRAQTYLALTGGTKGILYWVWPAAYSGNWQMLRQLASEMQALREVILEQAPAQTVAYAQAGTEDALKVLIKNEGGKTWLIAVNSLPNPLQVQFSLPQRYRGTVRVAFEEDRELALEGAAFADSFEGYGRRVYELSGDDGEWPEGATLTVDVQVGDAPEEPVVNTPGPSKNRVRNSGFERDFPHLPGWPINWYPVAVEEPGFIGAEGSRWSVDDSPSSEPFEGQRSLRMVKTEPGVATSTQMWHLSHAPAAEAHVDELQPGTYVASVYLKASAPNTSAWIFSGHGDTKIVSVGTTWERFSVPFTIGTATKSHFVRVYLRQQGTLWVDAAQVEGGTTPTPYVPGQ